MPRKAVWAALVLAAITAAWPPPASLAQIGAPRSDAKLQDARADGPARVMFMNREITEVRAPFLTASPAQRAVDAEKRIERALVRGGPGRVARRTIEHGVAITVDGTLVFMLIPGDVDSLAGESLEAAAMQTTTALSQAVAAWHEAHDSRQILWGVAWAALATVIFAIVINLLMRVHRWLSTTVSATAARQVAKVSVGGLALVREDVIGRLIGRLLAFLIAVVSLVVGYMWITFVFRRFPYTRPWGEGLRGLLIDNLSAVFGQILGALPNLVVAVLIFGIARFVARSLDAFFEGIETRQLEIGWLDRDTVPPTRRIAGLVVWLFALAMAYPYLPGSDTEAFKGVSVLAGLMISLGASNVIGQAASGLVLMYSRSFRAGEFVRIGETEGRLVELGLFATRLRTAAGVEVTIPNAVVLGTVTRNNSRGAAQGAHVLETGVTIGYDAPWRQVHAMLIEAARRTRGVLADPPPRVYQVALSDFYVDYRLFCQFRLEEGLTPAIIRDTVHANIQDQFNENGVQIMSPHYEGDPEKAKVVPKERWNVASSAPTKT